jgi:hypothetical protein
MRALLNRFSTDVATRNRRNAPQRRIMPVVEGLEHRALLTFGLTSSLTIGGYPDVVVNALAVDAHGNSYVAGDFTGTVNFNPNPSGPPDQLSSVDSSTDEGFVAEYSQSNALIWVYTIQPASGGSVVPESLVVNPTDGSIYVAGIGQGTVNFDPGTTGQSYSLGANDAVFIVRLTASGALAENGVVFFAGTNDSSGADGGYIALDPTDQYLYVTGTFTGTAQYVALGVPTLTSGDGGSDAGTFILKLETNFSYVWSTTSGLWGDGYAIAVEGDGSIVIAGDLLSEEPSSAYVEALNSTGAILNLQEFGDTGAGQYAEADRLVVDSSGNVYVAGRYDGDTTIGAIPLNSVNALDQNDEYNIYLAKLDPSLDPVWVRGFGSSDLVGLPTLAMDSSDNLYLGDTLDGPTTFGTTTGPGTLISSTATTGNGKACLFKVDSSGDLLDWATASGPGLSTVKAAAETPSGSIEVAGEMSATTSWGSASLQPPAGAVSSFFLADFTEGAASGSTSATAPVFLGESRVVVRLGKHHKKTTYYQLDFSGPLESTEVIAPGLYPVTQVKKLSKHRTRTTHVGVSYVTYNSTNDTIRLSLGKFAKRKPLTLSASGLIGANGAVVNPFSTPL